MTTGIDSADLSGTVRPQDDLFRYVNGQNTHDYLQNDVPMARLCAEEEWGLSPAAWREALPGELPLCQQRSIA